MSEIAQNLAAIKEKIRSIAPDPSIVKLLAVSKTKPVEMILEAFRAGQILFGENKVQEARDKKPFLPPEIDLHLIGPLQTNKAKYSPELFSTIHSIARTEEVELLQKHCLAKGEKLNLLLQMNLSHEESKSGIQDMESLKKVSDRVMESSELKLIGLMTIPNPDATEKETREVFHKLYEINRREAERLGISNQMTELSMGMSHDFEWALQEGATIIRLGSSIFGERNYT